MTRTYCPDCGGPLFRRRYDEDNCIGLNTGRFPDADDDSLSCRICELTSMTSAQVLQLARAFTPDRHRRWLAERGRAAWSRDAVLRAFSPAWLPAGCSATSRWFADGDGVVAYRDDPSVFGSFVSNRALIDDLAEDERELAGLRDALFVTDEAPVTPEQLAALTRRNR